MRVIYVDEAGIAAHEPVTVVVGIVVHGDTQWIPAAQDIRAAIERWVPGPLRENYVFHATDLLGDKYRDVWDFDKRIGLLHEMMEIPLRLDLPIALGVATKAKFPAETVEYAKAEKLNKDQLAHALAFACSMTMAGRFLREGGGIRELGIAVCEDTQQMKRKLKPLFAFLRTNRQDVKPRSALHNGVPIEAVDSRFSATEIIDTVHFAEKKDAMHLQLADACAFGLRRFLSRLHHGEEYGKRILGDAADLSQYLDTLTSTDTGTALFYASRKRQGGVYRISYSIASADSSPT